MDASNRQQLKTLLQHGRVTTEQLKNLCGYNHFPRAARDVREIGIPLETFKTKNADGRTNAKKAGLRTLARKVCILEQALQIDHGVPCEIAGDKEEQDGFMKNITTHA